MSKNANNFALAILVASLPIVFLFQNCGQKGQINTSSSANNSVSTGTDSFIVETSKTINNSVDSTASEEDKIHISNPTVTAEDLENSKASGSQPTKVSSDSLCNNINISDLLLNVASLSNGSVAESKNNASFALVDSTSSISMGKLSIKVLSLKDLIASNLFLELGQTGNKILSSNNEVLNLTTPSAQSAGIKIKLNQAFSLKANKNFSLVLDLNPAEQLVVNSNKCIFKPVVKSATLMSLD